MVYYRGMKHLHDISHGGVVWVNVTKQGEKELREIQQRFGLLEPDIKESLPPFQRPKIVKRGSYYFLVLQWPVFDRDSRKLGFTEVDFFLSGQFLLTVHDGKLVPLGEFFAECAKGATARANYFAGTAAHLLLELLSRLLDSIFPILLHVNDDITRVDRMLFRKLPPRELAEEILRLKTNTVTFRRTMQGHRLVLDRLIRYAGRELDLGSYQHYLNDLREFAGEIWQMLESQKESINALHETSESLLAMRTNEIMKTLTIIAVLTFPLTLLATVLAVRARGTPLVGWPGGFWIILALVILGAGGMLGLFKKKGWL